MSEDYSELSQVSLFLIDQTSKIAKHYSQSIFDELGIDIIVDQWVLLKIIEENIPMSQKELADKSLRDPASITRSLDILQKKDLITRQKMPADRRQYIICLSQKGQEFIEKNMPLVNKMRAQSLQDFTKSEIDTLHRLLRKMQSNFK